MILNFLKTALTRDRKNKLGTAINLIGLVTGFIIFSFSFAFVQYEKGYDKFFSNYENIVMPYLSISPTSGFNVRQFFSIYSGMRLAAQTQLDQVTTASFVAKDEHSVRIDQDIFRREIQFVNPEFFDIFELEFTHGGFDKFSSRTDIVFLSEREALTIFGSSDVIGKTIFINESKTLEVSGVYKNLPINSHFTSRMGDAGKFDYIASIKVYEEINNETLDTNWAQIGSNVQVYFLLQPNTDRTLLEKDLKNILYSFVSERSKEIFDGVSTQTLSERNLNNWAAYKIPGLTIAMGVGVLILGIAILNSLSLTTAHLISRSHEIGMRRVLGASNWNIISLLFKESIIATFSALLIALLVIYLLLPAVSQLVGREFNFALMFTPTLFTFLATSGLVVAILNVSYPALLLLKIGKNNSLGRNLKLGHQGVSLRLTLATIQFAITTALIFSVFVVARQNQHLMEKAPEFLTEKIVTISGLYEDSSRAKFDVLKASLTRLPGVEMVANSSKTPFRGGININSFKRSPTDADPFSMQTLYIGDQFLPLYNIPLLAGRNFDLKRADDLITSDEEVSALNVIVNEKAMKELKISNPIEAIGFVFHKTFGDKSIPATIVGVIPNTNFGGPSQEIMPLVISTEPRRINKISLFYSNSGDIDLNAINTIWKSLVPAAPVSVQILGETFEASQQPLVQIKDAFITISIVAIILAATGLYSLASYLAVASKKEMSIRRVVGARTYQLIIAMLSKFSKPLVLAILIGLPIGELSMSYYLERFSERIEPEPIMFLITSLLILGIAYITVFSHTWRVAKTHPAEVLRCD